MPQSDIRPSMEFRVSVNGEELAPDVHNDIRKITVHLDINAASMFLLEINTWDRSTNQATWIDRDLFSPGSEVKIEGGYVDQMEELIVGEIIGLDVEFKSTDMPILIVRGYDRSHRLLQNKNTRSFTDMKDSDIVSQIASEFGLTAEVEDTGITMKYVLQSNQTDMEFLQDRARNIGYEVMIENKTLHFRPRQNDSGELLTLRREEEALFEFYPHLSMIGQASKVIVRAYDPSTKEEIVGEAGVGDESGTMGGTSGPEAAQEAFEEATVTVVDCPVSSQEEADNLALSRFNERAQTYIKAEGVVGGHPEIKAGTVILIEDVGSRLSGPYYVTSVTHTFSPARGYRAAFYVTRNAEGEM